MIISPNFSHNILKVTWITPSLNRGYPLICVHTSHCPYGYPLLIMHLCQWTHGNPCSSWYLCHHCTKFYLPCGWEQLHALPSTTFNSFHQQIDIVLTKDDICTIFDIIIINPTGTYLLPQSCATQGFVAFDVAQAKKGVIGFDKDKYD